MRNEGENTILQQIINVSILAVIVQIYKFSWVF